ncbi:protein numb homolog isoform X2 [Anneissia japonica]|uniref:protein numb homolog isoform X2 n=1 Tax=Anneissia japonica TaxID=1529436 RepID=UPI0014258A88|nr:protein numb homolog isoform X2 [Anneissia japonica]
MGRIKEFFFGGRKRSSSAGGEASSPPKRGGRLRRSLSMKKLRRSFRRKDARVPTASKPHQWQQDEKLVRAGSCNFSVKYLGSIEVTESRGMNVCEEAAKTLRDNGKKKVRAILWVASDSLRVVEEDAKGLLVDQTIEKVSFCAPDRNHDRGFSYICRDGTTRRWLCHCFQSLRDPGERLSHAVGCAFAACLERKQQRDKLCGVKVEFDVNKTTFTRQGSFRQATMTEQLAEAEQNKDKENEGTQPIGGASVNPYAIPRRHAPDSLLQRQGSCRLFPALDTQSPFKRNLSLRLNELPSTLQRQQQTLHSHPELSPIHSPTREEQEEISEQNPEAKTDIAGMCQQLSQGLFQLSQVPDNQPLSSTPMAPTNRPNPHGHAALQPVATPIRQTNPWAKEESEVVAGSLKSTDTHAPVQKSYNPFIQQQNGHVNGHTHPAVSSQPAGNTLVSAQVHSALPVNYNNANSTAGDVQPANQNGLAGNWTSDMSNSLPAMEPAPAPANFEARWEAFGDETKMTNENANNPFANAVKTFEVNL